MKIALYSTQLFPSTPELKGYGGLELIVGLLAKYYDEHGHEVHLFAHKDSYVPKNGKLYSVDDVSARDNEKVTWRSYFAEPDAKKAFLDADIIHDHSWGFSPYQLFEEKNGNICHTFHGTSFVRKSQSVNQKINFITVSFNNARNQAEWNDLVWRAVQNGIDISKYPFKKDKQDYLLWASRIMPVKGCHRFIDLCDKMQMKGKIFGGSIHPDPVYMSQIKKQLRNSKYVTLVGNLGEAIPFEQKVELYQNAKAVVLPVIEEITIGKTLYQFKEPFGLIAPEANACGTPVIVTPSGGWNETTIHGKTGFFANSDDDFMYYIKRLDEIKPKDCRKHAEWFSYERMAQEYLSLYREINQGRCW